MSCARPAGDGGPRHHPLSVIAHRGSSEDAPEHTLAAYRRAVEVGADGLECDVRLTADGHLVCVHDRRVNRTSNGRGAVSGLELADLAALDFGSWKAAAGTAEEPDLTCPPRSGPVDSGRSSSARWDMAENTSVLTLERLLELVVDAGRRVELAIETKHPTRWAGRIEERLIALLDRFGLAHPEPTQPPAVRVMSFSVRSLRRVHAAAPALPTVHLTQMFSPRHRDGRLPPGVSIAGPGIRAVRNHPECVARFHQAGHSVHVWTVDAPADVDLCIRLGVEAIITNRPKQVLYRLGRSERP